MPIPNLSTLYQRIGKGAEGGLEFERLMKLFLIADYDLKGKKFISESGASGDYKKIDAYSPGNEPAEKLNTSYQFKFFPSKLSSRHRREIEESIISALEENEFIHHFIIVTPEDFMKEDQYWFESLRNKYNKKYWLNGDFGAIGYTFDLIHWGHTKIIELALRHDSIGIYYFPELYPLGVGKFKLAEATMDCKNSNWTSFDSDKFSFHQSYPNYRIGLTTDPLFDFHFTNSSPEIFLLKKIEIHVFDITTKIKGPAVDYFLKSIGTLEYEIDFTKPVNTFELDDPMVFEANKPLRFKIQLRNFTKKSTGNCTNIKFWFHFSNCSLPSEEFYLIF